MKKIRTATEFLRKHSHSYQVVDRGFSTPCWIWLQCKNQHGYGRKRFGKKLQYAHRAFFEALCTAVPDGMEPDHLCRQRDCVNPAHIELVTKTENRRRAKPLYGKAAQIRKQYATGAYSQQELADIHGCKQVAISRLVRGVTHGETA